MVRCINMGQKRFVDAVICYKDNKKNTKLRNKRQKEKKKVEKQKIEVKKVYYFNFFY